jgi:nucleoside-diphosphate-sugar epimerase
VAERKTRLVVTGATGFLGQRASALLRERGYDVIGLGRNPLIGKTLEQNGVQFIQCDLSDREALRKAFEGADIVVHSAALASPWGPWKDFEAANVRGTRNVVESCLANQRSIKRLVHISSPAIYMNLGDRRAVREDQPLPDKQISHYARSKRLAEEIVFDRVKQLSFIILRPQGIFGPGDTSILPRLIRIAERGVLPLIGNGKNEIDMTYVDNVVDSIALAMEAPEKCAGQAYNITNGEPVLNYSLIQRVLRELGYEVRLKKIPFSVALGLAGTMQAFYSAFLPASEPLLTPYSVCLLSRTRTLNIDRARNELGYNPRISMEEGLKRYLDWWKKTSVDRLRKWEATKQGT